MGRTRTTPKLTVFSIGIGLAVLFQNMTPIEFSLLNVPAVDEGARTEQARELLGAYYQESPARKAEGAGHLNYLLFKEIEASLAPQWKHRALELTQTLIAESREQNFDPIFVLAVIQTESRFNPNAIGTRGEIGLMQILPPTGKWIALKYHIDWAGDRTLHDPVTNIVVGIRYFSYLRSHFERTAQDYVPAYNMGPKNLKRVNREERREEGRDIGRKLASVDEPSLPAKRIYAIKVLKNYETLYQKLISAQSRMGTPTASAESVVDPRLNP
jgi:soluble lytic murein transglycosylase